MNGPESSTLAGFEVADSEKIADTYCAMSNSDGGQIVVGVRREEAVYGRPDWTPIGILAEEESGQVIRNLESMIDGSGISISFDLVPLPQEHKDAPERTVLIIIAKKIGNPKERMSVRNGQVFLRRGSQNVAETALERLERGKSLFRPEQFRTGPSKNPENTAEPQPFVAPAGVPPEGIGYGTLGGWPPNVTREFPAAEMLEAASSDNRPNYDTGDKLSFESHVSDGRLKFGGEAKTSFTVNQLDPAVSTDTKGTSAEVHVAEGDAPAFESPGGVSPDKSDQARSPLPQRRLLGARLQISREATESEEALNSREHANVLAAFFATTKDDVCFGLFGHWGRGKTYLINKVSEVLQRDHGYQIIKFSAWKYRSTPEVWAHLYETIATASRSGSVILKVLSPYRAMLARYGIWPMIFAYVSFGFSLFTVHDKLWFGQFILEFLGFTGTAYFALLFIRLQGFSRNHARPLLKLTSHREKLGLQAAIGDDLKAILMGWMPGKFWQPAVTQSSSGNVSKSRYEKFKHLCVRIEKQLPQILGIVVYSLVTLFVLTQLAPEGSKTINIPVYGRLDATLPTSVINLVYALWGFIAVGLPLAALCLAKGPKRLLLVVDDLDRCEPTQMLEIIESVMLLLDDKEIRQRMQIVMLVEEEAVRAAILQKYTHLRCSTSPGELLPEEPVQVDDRIVRENLEKLFVSYLRLPEIPPDDFRNLLSKYIEGDDAKPDDDPAVPGETDKAVITAAQTSESQLPKLDSKFVEMLEVIFPSDSVKKKQGATSSQFGRGTTPAAPSRLPIEYASALKLSRHERTLLLQRLENLRGSERVDIRWGPRTVRSYLHKYRLARALWIALNPKADFDAEALLSALMPIDASQTNDSDHLLDYIVAQVS